MGSGGEGWELLQGRHWVQIAMKFLTNWYIYTAWKQLQEMGMVRGGRELTNCFETQFKI